MKLPLLPLGYRDPPPCSGHSYEGTADGDVTCSSCGMRWVRVSKTKARRVADNERRAAKHETLLARLRVVQYAEQTLHTMAGEERAKVAQWCRTERKAIRDELRSWHLPYGDDAKHDVATVEYVHTRKRRGD